MNDRTRIASQRGQASATYMGVLVAVGFLFAALFATPLGGVVAGTIDRVICEIGGGTNCGEAPREPALSSCIRDQAEREGEAHVKVTIFVLEGGVKAVREERGDGSVKVTLEGNADAGLEFATPSADVDLAGTETGTGQRELRVTGGGALARSWVFDEGSAAASGEAADQFQDDVIDKVKAHVDLNPFNSGPDLPDHDETAIQGGVEVSAAGELSSGTGLEGNLAGAVGATFKEDGGKEVFFEVRGGLGADVEAAELFEFGGAAGGQVRVGLTYDAQGEPVEMKVYGRADGSLNASAEIPGGNLDQALDQVDGNLEAGAGGRVALDATLDLTDPANRQAALSFIDGADPDTGEGVSRFDAAGDLYDRFRDDGDVSVQTYSTSESETGAEFDATAFGAGFRYAETDAALQDAWYLGEQGFQPWLRCTGELPS